MIVSRGRNYIFVHIPKTGGTSMALALEERAMADDIMIGDTPKAVKRRGKVKGLRTAGRLWKHSTLADAEGLITRDEMAKMFTFTLVRNPWDRMVSYYHWLQTQSFDHPAVTLAKAMGFSDFVNAPLTMDTFRANSFASYMSDGAGVTHADLYIRLEHVAEDIAPLATHLGFTPDLPVANVSGRPLDYRTLYSEVDAELISQICAPDIEAHGYLFDPG